MKMHDNDEIVGHKTFSDGKGGFYHKPLTKVEADAIWEQCKAEEEKRAVDMPTETDALHTMFQAYQRLREIGWKEAIYCPKDGTPFQAIEPGSTGIHETVYQGEWPKGYWYVMAEGDLWPSRPCLFKPYPEQENTQ